MPGAAAQCPVAWLPSGLNFVPPSPQPPSNISETFDVFQNQRTSIRQATLLAFRDCVLLKLATRLEPLLDEMNAEGSVPPAMRQMMLVLQVQFLF
jgi:hypothetical protein